MEDCVKKAMIVTFAMFVIFISCAVPAMAQDDSTEMAFIEQIRSDLKRERVAIVGDAMFLTSDEAAAFWPIYEEYEAETNRIGDSLLAIIIDFAAIYPDMNDEKALELSTRMLVLQQERLDVKKRYVNRFTAELSPTIAARFLQVDNRISLLIDYDLASQVPLIPVLR